MTRIQSIPSRIGELFYLRAFLQYRLAYGFADLRTVRGRVYITYQEAAAVLGLFQDKTESEHALQEVIAAYSRFGQFRFLFVHLILSLSIPAITFWTRFREVLSADFAARHNEAEAIRRTLEDISRYLHSQGASLTHLGLPEPARVERQINLELDVFAQFYDVLQVRSQQAYGMLNQEQRLVYDSVMGSIPTGDCYFFNGKAGRGKTFLVNAICDRIRGEGYIACIIGFTALSVTLYERGRTAHLMFGILVRENASDLQLTISVYSRRAEVFRHAALIV